MRSRDALLATLFVSSVIAHGALLISHAPGAYYLSVQEDEYLEWATFWAFVAACVGWLVAASRSRAPGQVFPWFFVGLAVFCLFVALEEISWGQGVFAYRAPRYFLEHNFQLEMNLHNLMETSSRKRALYAVVAGYGIALPLACISARIRGMSSRLGVSAPPVALVAPFAITLGLYVWYPWSHTGESVELMLGLCFAFAAIAELERTRVRLQARSAAWLSACFAIVLSSGFGSAELSRLQRFAEPGNVVAAEREVAALASDFLDLERPDAARLATRCGLHKRVHSYIEKYGKQALRAGRFAQLVRQGLPQDRADFLLDPWNSPYWIRHVCDEQADTEVAFVYSFGPDRVRDSNRSGLRGDDIGQSLLQEPQ